MCRCLKKFYDELGKIENPKLTEFLWNGNVITPKTIDFLKKCNITWLSLAGCLECGDPNLKDLLLYIANSTLLTTLIIGGGKGKILKDDMKLLLKAIGANRSVQTLDIQKQGFGKEMIPYLTKAIMDNRNIKFIFLKQNKLDDPKDLLDFYKSLKGRGAPFKAAHDIDIKKRNLPDLFDAVSSVRDGDPTIIIPTENLQLMKEVTYEDLFGESPASRRQSVSEVEVKPLEVDKPDVEVSQTPTPPAPSTPSIPSAQAVSAFHPSDSDENEDSEDSEDSLKFTENVEVVNRNFGSDSSLNSLEVPKSLEKFESLDTEEMRNPLVKDTSSTSFMNIPRPNIALGQKRNVKMPHIPPVDIDLRRKELYERCKISSLVNHLRYV